MRDRGVAIDVVSATPKEQIAWLKRIELERIFVAAQNGIEISSFAHPDVLLARIARNIFEPVFGQKKVNKARAIHAAVGRIGRAVWLTQILFCYANSGVRNLGT